MSARFEVVRSNRFEQPWHARLVSNGRILMSSEQYARKVGAQRAIEAMGRAFSPVGMAMLNGDWLNVWLDRDGSAGEKTAIPVRYIDERSKP
jgi:uncharacterized protein YegP (UPF0339 family)